MMCPDRETLSAFIDGEVPAPWDGRIREHVEHCPACRSVVEGYAELRRSLRSAPEPAVTAADSGDLAAVPDFPTARVWRTLSDAMAFSRPRARGVPRMSVPVPLVAAAAVAIVALAFSLGALWRQNQTLRMAALQSEEMAPAMTRMVGMDSIEQYLDQQNGPVTITVQLPGGTTLTSYGGPVIMKADGGDR